MWFRVFGTRDTAPEPAAFLEHLYKAGLRVPGHFGGDEQGWFRVDFVIEEGAPPLRLDRFLIGEEDLRDEINAWAAWLETLDDNEYYGRLMQHVISTQQLFSMECSRDRFEEESVRNFCIAVCEYLARETKGVYQVDNLGFFAANSKLLVPE